MSRFHTGWGSSSWRTVVTMVAPCTSLLKLVETICASAESDKRFSMPGVNEMMESSAATIPPTMIGMTATTTTSSINVKPLSSQPARVGESRARVVRAHCGDRVGRSDVAIHARVGPCGSNWARCGPASSAAHKACVTRLGEDGDCSPLSAPCDVAVGRAPRSPMTAALMVAFATVRRFAKVCSDERTASALGHRKCSVLLQVGKPPASL